MTEEHTGTNRRDFLKHSTGAVVGGSLAATLASCTAPQEPEPVVARVIGDSAIRVGLIGCGSRGNGAAVNAIQADEGVWLTAMADAFEDQLDRGCRLLAQQLGDKFAVEPEHRFHGFDAYRKVLESDVDVVLLCTPPHFRPAQLRAAILAGKHVFCEKPVAVDPTGIRSVLESAELARKQNLSIVSGLCYRYDAGVRETVQRIHDGAIGDIVTLQVNYLSGPLWHRGRKPDWSEMEYQMRNWLYFTWLSGDHIVEQHVHSLDKALWVMGDQPPATCYGLGGRQVRSDEKWGHVYDHFTACYEWENGQRLISLARQMAGCHNHVEDYVFGTKGQARLLRHAISGESDWQYPGRREKPNMFQVEHDELFAAVRSGQPINNGQYSAYSTLMGIMGREACYTGQWITWDQILNSEQDLTPRRYAWGDIPVPDVAMPGMTRFV